jgi:hypothetical protein
VPGSDSLVTVVHDNVAGVASVAVMGSQAKASVSDLLRRGPTLLRKGAKARSPPPGPGLDPQRRRWASADLEALWARGNHIAGVSAGS